MLSWLNIFPSLPKHSGSHPVGSTEIEVPISTLSLDHTHPLVSTVKLRLFYPAETTRDSRAGVQWIPQPQEQFIRAAFKVAKIGPLLGSILRFFFWWISSLRMPVYQDASFLKGDKPRPVMVFSHGLANWINSESSVLGELASHGMICVAVEHRDESAVYSSVRSDTDEIISSKGSGKVDFRGISLKIRPSVMEARDEQLRIRLFELAAVYKVLELLTTGQSIKNLAGSGIGNFRSGLDLSPGAVTWIGYSFGGTTIVQFIKSVFYGTRSDSKELQVLLGSTPSASLAKQITTASPVVLLDPWYLPLKSPNMAKLYNKPLPCYRSTTPTSISNVCVILSSEFAFHTPECHSHMPALLTADPSLVPVETQAEYDAMTSRYKTAGEYVKAAKVDKGRYQKQLRSLQSTASPHVRTYVLRHTIHTTLCDYGIVMPWAHYLLGGQRDPVSAKDNIVRCVLKQSGKHDLWEIVPSSKSAADKQLQQILASDTEAARAVIDKA